MCLLIELFSKVSDVAYWPLVDEMKQGLITLIY